MNPRSTDCEADALTTTPSRRSPSLSLTLTLHHDLVIWTDGFVPFPFGKGGFGILLCVTAATVSFLTGPVCLSLSAKACAILQALCWSRQH